MNREMPEMKGRGDAEDWGMNDETGLQSLDWKRKLVTAEDRLVYLKTALRYWYSKDWYGSEKRKGTSDAV